MGWRTSPCKGCGEPMVWAKTERGKNMPLDPEEVDRRDVGPKITLFDIVRGEDGKPAALVSTSVRGHVAHWVTCEKRDEFKRER